MGIIINLDEMLWQRRMTLTQLADKVDLTLANLSILKTGKSKSGSVLDTVGAVSGT